MVFIGHDIDISISSFHMHKCDEFNWHFAELACFFLTLSLFIHFSVALHIGIQKMVCMQRWLSRRSPDTCKDGSPETVCTAFHYLKKYSVFQQSSVVKVEKTQNSHKPFNVHFCDRMFLNINCPFDWSLFI